MCDIEVYAEYDEEDEEEEIEEEEEVNVTRTLIVKADEIVTGDKNSSSSSRSSNINTNSHASARGDENSSTSSSSNSSQTNLIINYLPQTMVDDEFRALFATVGPLDACKLVRHRATRENLGYGFVRYARAADAARAVRALNGLHLEHKVVKVSYARTSCDSIRGANLYVCGLPRRWTQADMNRHFGAYGQIITSRVLLGASASACVDGKSTSTSTAKSGTAPLLSKGVGFVRFNKRSEAERAIRHLHGTRPDGAAEHITVKFANFGAAAAAAAAATATAAGAGASDFKAASFSQQTAPTMSVYAAWPQYEHQYQQHQQQQHFGMAAQSYAQQTPVPYESNMNALYGASVPLAPVYYDNRYYGMSETASSSSISSGSSSAADDAQMHSLLAFGAATVTVDDWPMTKADQQLQLQQQQQEQQQQQQQMLLHNQQHMAAKAHSSGGWCLFVYNLAAESGESVLWQLFGPLGAVQSVRLARTQTSGRCKGYGFVTMSDYADAVRAISTLDGALVADRVIQVSFKTQQHPHQHSNYDYYD